MLLAAINKQKRLLHLSFIGHVGKGELERGWADLSALVADLGPGFRLLTDLGRLESMDPDCETQLGRAMEFCDQNEVELVVRVIPDPQKDIGMNILSLFHYKHRVRTVTCESMEEAARALQL
jgi:hypothetical protein